MCRPRKGTAPLGAGLWLLSGEGGEEVLSLLPISDNLGSLALFMASTIAHPLTLVKRVSAIVVKRSDFGVLSRAEHLRRYRLQVYKPPLIV